MPFSIKNLALVVSLGLMSAQLSAVQHVTQEQYRQLLPLKNGQTDYQLKLADKVRVNYHCPIFETPDGGFDIDRANCTSDSQFYNINWKTEFPGVVALSILGAPSSDTIEEHKLWALAFAHASASSRLKMQYGLRKGLAGTFDLSRSFATGETFGQYFQRQMNPNYFVSKGLQESSLGNDLPDVPMSETLDDDGVLQVEYPGSAWSELQGIAGGGFPIPFAAMDPKKVLSSNNGPARNILGSAITSGFYNGSALAIVSGSLPWSQNSASPQDKMNEFLQIARDPDALSMLMSFMYNRGPYAAKEQPLRDQATFDYCASLTEELEDDWRCFHKQNDFGSRYIRQIPDATNILTSAAEDPATAYETRLSKEDIRHYLRLLGTYGFYPSASITKATQDGLVEFDKLAQAGTISYRNDFGRVLEKIIVALPVYELSEGGPYDQSSKKQLYFYNLHSETVLAVTLDSTGQVGTNAFVSPRNSVLVDLNGSFQQLTVSGGGKDCTAAATSALQTLAAEKDATYVSLSSQLTFKLSSEGACEFASGDHQPPAPVPEGYWDPAKLYDTPGLKAIDGSDCKQYTNSWYISGGNPPSQVYQNDPWGVWRPVSDTQVSGCVPSNS